MPISIMTYADRHQIASSSVLHYVRGYAYKILQHRILPLYKSSYINDLKHIFLLILHVTLVSSRHLYPH